MATLAAARAVGFDNISCDLMFAIPGQSFDEWIADLTQLIELGLEHVSTYNLTYEHGTAFTGLRDAGRIEPASEDLERAMYEAAIERLTHAGYRHYEISNFARPGHEARHNLSYWSWSDYLGVGAGAHGFTKGRGDDDEWGSRYANVRLPEHYMSATAGDWAASQDRLDREAAMSEFILLGLRLLDGFAEDGFAATFGCSLVEAAPATAQLTIDGFVEREDGRIRLSRNGLMLADSVITNLATLQ